MNYLGTVIYSITSKVDTASMGQERSKRMKILVAYDGSEIAQRALTVAQRRAKALSAELHIFTATADGKIDCLKNTRLDSGLKDSQMLCQASNIKCIIEISEQTMSVAEALVRYARENDIDEIVIGLRRRSQLGKLLFGSTSRQVILDAPCPVLSVK